MKKFVISIIVLITLLIFGYLFYKSYFFRKLDNIIYIKGDNKPFKIKPKYTSGVVIPYSDSLIYENFSSQKTTNRNLNFIYDEHQIAAQVSNDKMIIDNRDDITILLNELEIYEELHKTQSKDDLDNLEPDNIMPNVIASEKNHGNLFIVGNTRVQFVDDTLPHIYRKKQNPKKYYRLQLGTFISEEELKKKSIFLFNRFDTLLKNSTFYTEKIVTEDGVVVFTLFAGDYKHWNDAARICSALINYKQICFIAK